MSIIVLVSYCVVFFNFYTFFVVGLLSKDFKMSNRLSNKCLISLSLIPDWSPQRYIMTSQSLKKTLGVRLGIRGIHRLQWLRSTRVDDSFRGKKKLPFISIGNDINRGIHMDSNPHGCKAQGKKITSCNIM